MRHNVDGFRQLNPALIQSGINFLLNKHINFETNIPIGIRHRNLNKRLSMFVSKIFLMSSLLLSCLFLWGCPDSLTKWDEGDKKGSTSIAVTEEPSAATVLAATTSDMIVYELTPEKLQTSFLTHKLHRAGTGNWTPSPSVECSVATVDSDTAVSVSEDIVCWLDVEENDLHFNGINLAITVKPGTCDYIGFNPYYFWKWQPGISSSSKVIIRTGEESCIGDDTDPTPSSQTCAYDYSNSEGPNCDQGYYTSRVFSKVTSTSTDDPPVTTETCVAEDTIAECGGLYRNCYGGGGTQSEFLVNDHPAELIIPSLESGYDNRTAAWSFTAPITSGFYTNLYLANYLKQCTNDIPGANRFTYKTSPELFGFSKNSGIDIAAAKGTSHAVDPFRGNNPYYGFTCYDRAKDVKARIRVIVREWDRRFSSTDAGLIKGNPDLVHTEPLMDYPSWPENDFDFGDWNDFSDWQDLLIPGLGGCQQDNVQNYYFPGNSL
jgi:hypothetical protein